MTRYTRGSDCSQSQTKRDFIRHVQENTPEIIAGPRGHIAFTLDADSTWNDALLFFHPVCSE